LEKNIPGKNATVIRKKRNIAYISWGMGKKNKTGYVFMRVMSEAE